MPDFSSPSQQLRKRIMGIPHSRGPVAPSSALENFSQALSIEAYEHLSISDWLVKGNYIDERDRKLTSLRNAGVIPPELFNKFVSREGELKGDLLSRYLNSRSEYGARIADTDDDITKKIREDLVLAKDRYEEIQSRATFIGKLAGFGGTMTAHLLDPVIWPAMLIGYGQAATGLKALGQIGKVMLAEGAMESIKQFKVHRWRNEISEASIEDSIRSILWTVGAVGGLGIAAKSLSSATRRFLNAKGVRRLKETVRDWNNHKIYQMIDEMDDADFTTYLERRVANQELKDKLIAIRNREFTDGKVKPAKTVESDKEAITAAEETAASAERSAAKAKKDLIREQEIVFKRDAEGLIKGKSAKILAKEGLVKDVVGESNTLLIESKSGNFYTVEYRTKKIRQNAEKVIKKHIPEPEPVKAVNHTKRLAKEEERLNNIRYEKPVVKNETLPNQAATKTGRDLPKSMQKAETPTAEPTVKAVRKEVEEVAAPTVSEEVNDSLDVTVDSMLKENPNLEVPVGTEVVAGAEKPVMRRAKDVMKEFDDKAELTNLFKECNVSG